MQPAGSVIEPVKETGTIMWFGGQIIDGKLGLSVTLGAWLQLGGLTTVIVTCATELGSLW